MKISYFLMLTGLIFFLLPAVHGQNHYRVYFTDKGKINFDPYSYFSKQALERRIRTGLPIFDYSDCPVNENYAKQVADIADSTGFASRWFNFLSVFVSSDAQIEAIKALSFVSEIEYCVPIQAEYCETETEKATFSSTEEYLNSDKQTNRMGGNLFREKGIDGKGVIVAIFDGGFPEVDIHPAFEAIRDENRILKTWDFIKNKEFVYYGNSHGRMTFACVAGKFEGHNIGLATGAQFLLAKTEVNGEYLFEEEKWLAAAEWADKNGADIISSSLGYGKHRYFTWNMDGKYSLVSKAASMAARKGILVVNSAGNEATDGNWETIITPSDADSVLCIGGINPTTDFHISFSSIGPSASHKLKPNVSAYGHVITASENDLTWADGTSFSCPLTSGFAACAWQTNRNLTNMELFKEIEKSGHLYPYFDYAHGYGVPQASYFLNLNSPPKQTFSIFKNGDAVKIRIFPTVFNDTNFIQNMNQVYVNVMDIEGHLVKYMVLDAQELIFELPLGIITQGSKINVWFRNYTATLLY